MPPTSIESLSGRGISIEAEDSQATNRSPNQRPDPRTEVRPQSISMFADIQKLDIYGGNFTQNIYNYQNFPLKSLPRSYDAAFNAAINSDNLSRRRCTEGTRVKIIAQIMEWARENDPTKAAPVYWLTGLAGLGKTTIAYTICELLEEVRLPFISYFCSLQLDSWNSKLLVTTLCGDLAELYNSFATIVSQLLEKNSKVINARLRTQIDELLAKPWQASISERINDGQPIPIIVVDALDESDRGTEFMEELLRVVHAGQLVGIKFLLTSRLDPRIVRLSQSFPPNAVCKLHEVDTADVQNDIEKYLREALPELQDEPELMSLSKRAGGLFIYATTAVRFISPPYSPPSVSEMRSHLQAMLDLGSSTSHNDSDERLLVDELYERILGDAFRDARVRATRLRILHTIICAESRIDMAVLTNLTNSDEGTVKKVVESLHPVLYVSSKDGCVYWYHASFPEFLLSRARAKITIVVQRSYPTYHEIDVFCDAPTYHGTLARRCFSVLEQSLHFNMCNLPSSYVFDADVPGLGASVNTAFSPTLRYVSRYWARHLLQAVSLEKDTDDLVRCLTGFVDNKLLFWIESMNLIGAKFECPSLLQDAGSWLEREKNRRDLKTSLTDAANFSAFFAGSPASKSTPHLYISVLSTWDHDSAMWRIWRDRFRFIPSISLPRGSITIPLMTILSPHPVNCIAFSPDGNWIVSGSNGDVGTYRNSLQVWDVTSGEYLRELRGHTHVVNSVAYSPDGSRIVSSSLDFSIRVWEAKTGKQQRTLPGDSKTTLAFSPDGGLIVAGYSNSVRVWNVKTGEKDKELQGHGSLVTSAAFSLDGSQIVSGSHDKSVRVWDAKTGEQLRELRGHTGVVASVAFLPDSNQIISGSWDQSVRVWDTKTGKQLRELRGHTNIVTSIASSSNGKSIISGSWDHSIRVWDTCTGELQRELRGHTGIVSSVILSPDGNRITSGSWDKSVRLWHAEIGNRLKALQGHANVVTSVAFLPDGDQIISVSLDNSVRIWDAKTGEQLEEGQGHAQNDKVTSVAFSFDSKRAVSGFENGSVRVWNSKTGEQLMQVQGHNNKVTAVAFSQDGHRIVSGSEARSLRVWDAMTGEHLRKLEGHFMQVFWVAFAPDGDRIISGSDGLRMWDAKTGEHLMELRGHTSYVTSGAFSHDGNQIVSGSHDKSVRVWDAETGNQLSVMQGHTNRITSVAFSPDRNQIVSGSEDKSVRLWDVGTGELHRELRGHTSHVTSVAFSPDGNQIVSGSLDQSVRVWTHLKLDALWVMNEPGWILSDGEKLVWVPSTIRNVLLRPHNSLVISRNGSARISFEQCRFGSLWHECYTP